MASSSNDGNGSSGRAFQGARIRRASVAGMFALGAVLLGGSSSATPPADVDSPYSVTLEDERGNALRTFRQDGTTFALGQLGERYDVRIENHTDRRVEAVLTVDGRDAVSGSVGDFVHARGYLVAPHGSVRIDGFRRSLDETAAFRFASPSSSYSARLGTPENVGVIGVAFFPERRLPVRAWRDDAPWYPPRPSSRPARPAWPSQWSPADESASAAKAEAQSPRKSASPAPAAMDAYGGPSGRSGSAGRYRGERSEGSRSRDAWDGRDARDSEGSAPSRLGTEYGEHRFSPVTEVSFERQSTSHPAAIVSLRYDDADGLVARGIELYPRPYWSEPAATYPDPFPANRFAPPPALTRLAL